jgi:hypothetical protein
MSEFYIHSEVMETILYRRTPIPVKTIPKGTLLFRLTKSAKDDLRGIPKKDGTRCILSNHNVFFYPNPFVGKFALSEFVRSKDFPRISVFVLKNDVKVIWLLKPSPYSRVDKNRKRFFMKRCSTARKGCVDRISLRGSHAPFNPCLSDTIIEKYPDVVGIMANAVGDKKRIHEGLPRKTMRVRKFFKMADDAFGSHSIPELVLHPLKQRPAKDLIVKPGDLLETNYKELFQLDSSNDDRLAAFMERHAVYNPETFFYTYKE